MDAEHLVVGLGNPGPHYIYTPHNAGFEAADRLRLLCRAPSFREDAGGLVAACRWRKAPFVILQPQRFMNCSGEVVIHWLRKLGLPPARMVVIYDDLDLPFGALRLKPSGSAGGHHGMESIIGRLGGDFARVRIGIADPTIPKARQVDYLLSPLPLDRWDVLAAAAALAAEAVRESLSSGWAKAMSLYNRTDPPGGGGDEVSR